MYWLCGCSASWDVCRMQHRVWRGARGKPVVFQKCDRHFVAMLGRLAAALAVPAAGYSGMKLLQSVREPFAVLFLAAFS